MKRSGFALGCAWWVALAFGCSKENVVDSSGASVCARGQYTCAGDSLRVCNADLSGWEEVAACPRGTCIEGKSVCSAGTDGGDSSVAEVGGSAGSGGTVPETGGGGQGGPGGYAGQGGDAGTLDGGAGAGGQSGPGGAGGAGGTSSDSDAGAESSTPECAVGQKQCKDRLIQSCVNGSWQDGIECLYVCADGECIGNCPPGLSKCSGQVVERCDDTGTWQSSQKCQNQGCSNGICIGECAPGSLRCLQNALQTCQSNATWGTGTNCSGTTPVCEDAKCVPESTHGQSCDGLAPSCGPYGTDSCCAAALVTGGSYNRSNDATFPATVGSFVMDKYEITVGRFRNFVSAWVSGWRPGGGDGKHTHLNNGNGLVAAAGGYETGWNPAWSAHLASTNSGWNTNLGDQVTSPDAGAMLNLPVRYISWFEAYAFCIWDGGFLPSEAEWNYAAAGGGGQDGQREFPWYCSGSPFIDTSYAVYCGDSCSGPRDVGTKSPKGDGKWGQSDLAGNVSEWTLDVHDNQYKTPCDNCASLKPLDPFPTPRAHRGGSFWLPGGNLTVSERGYGDAPSRGYATGARCVRAP